MADVTIDTEDLKALLFAAGAIKDCAPQKNVQYAQIADRLDDALKRAGDKWRDANRRQEWPERFGEPTAHELAALHMIERNGGTSRFGMREELLHKIDRSLVTNGFVEYGVYTESCVWANSGLKQHEHAERRVRLTERGIDAIDKARELARQQASTTDYVGNAKIEIGDDGSVEIDLNLQPKKKNQAAIVDSPDDTP